MAAVPAFAQTPGPPGGLTATQDENRNVTLTWTAGTSGGAPTGYIVQGGTSSGATDTVNQQIGNVTSYTVGRLTAGTTYYFRIRALNGFGISDPSTEVAITISCPSLAPPEALIWRKLTTTTARLVWVNPDAGSGGIDYSFRVEVGTAPGLANVVSLLVAGNRTFADVTYAAGLGTVHARVKRTRACGGDGPASEEVALPERATLPSSTALVNELHGDFVELKNASSSRLDVGRWRIFTAGEFGDVRLSVTLPLGTGLAAQCTFLLSRPERSDRDFPLTGAPEGGAAIVRPDGEIVDSIGRRMGSAESAVNGLHEGTPLSYRDDDAPDRRDSFARVADRDTDDNRADFIQLRTPTPQGSAPCSGNPPPGPGPTVPAAPTQLTAVVTGSAVTLMWTPSTTGLPLTHYLLEIGLTPAGNEFAPITLSSTMSNVTFFSAPNGTFYARLRAANAQGVSVASNEVTIVVCAAGCTAPPGAPAQLSAQISGNNVLLTWRRPTTGAVPTGYVLEAGTATGLANLGQFPTGSTNEFVIISGVPPGTYFVRVRAVNGNAIGAASNELMIVVQ